MCSFTQCSLYAYSDPRMTAMQILSRAASERISIGSEITLCVIAVNGTSVRLGVEAPRDISVHRDEIYTRIRDRNAGRLASGELAKD